MDLRVYLTQVRQGQNFVQHISRDFQECGATVTLRHGQKMVA